MFIKKAPVLGIVILLLAGCNIEPDGVYIYSVTSTPTSAEQITLKNTSDTDVDISDWTLGDVNDPHAYGFPNDTVLAPQEKKKFPRSTLGFQINDYGEVLYLKDGDGKTIDTWSN